MGISLASIWKEWLRALNALWRVRWCTNVLVMGADYCTRCASHISSQKSLAETTITEVNRNGVTQPGGRSGIWTQTSDFRIRAFHHSALIVTVIRALRGLELLRSTPGRKYTLPKQNKTNIYIKTLVFKAREPLFAHFKQEQRHNTRKRPRKDEGTWSTILFLAGGHRGHLGWRGSVYPISSDDHASHASLLVYKGALSSCVLGGQANSDSVRNSLILPALLGNSIQQNSSTALDENKSTKTWST